MNQVRVIRWRDHQVGFRDVDLSVKRMNAQVLSNNHEHVGRPSSRMNECEVDRAQPEHVLLVELSFHLFQTTQILFSTSLMLSCYTCLDEPREVFTMNILESTVQLILVKLVFVKIT